jgi:peptide/nickel transport system ATP-binding protein
MSDVVLKAVNVSKYFELSAYGRKKIVKAVDGVTIKVKENETLGIVGESSSGKSTLGRVILRIYRPTAGKIYFRGVEITNLSESKLRPMRKEMQLIPQDPYASFNPLIPVGEALLEPLLVHGVMERSEAEEAILKIFEKVGLVPPEEYFNRMPYQFSGGQLQRIAIARAMLLNPKLVVADEPTSSLDVSIRASILKLLKDFQERLQQAVIFITHDLALARLVSHRIAVMYLGKIVEIGPTEEIFKNPLHPYTAALLTAIPTLDNYRPRKEVYLKGEIPDPSKVPHGCRLHPRCPFAERICREKEPELIEVSSNHFVACHRIKEWL